MSFSDKIIAITVGIRYARSFGIYDVSGHIADDILNNNNSPFKGKFFDQIGDQPQEKMLLNTQTSEYFRINTDDVIFKLIVDNNFPQRIAFIKKGVVGYLEGSLFPRYNVENIVRVGVVFHHRFNKTDELRSVPIQITNNEIKTAEDISLTFSKKLATFEGFTKKDVKDYRNVIVTLQETKTALLANLDYQHYFEPARQDLRQCQFSNIISAGETYLNDKFYKWMEKYGTAKS